MAINNNLGFKETVQALGLKRRFFGLESDKSLARRAVTAMGKRRITSFFELMGRSPTPRVCIREEFEEIIHILKGCMPSGNKANNVKKWTFHYNDGTVETVILRGT